MKSLFTKLSFLLTASFISLALCGQSTSGQNAQEKEIRRNVERWQQAYNSKDGQQLAPLYTEDAVYISSHVEGLVAEGRDKVIANFQRGMSGGGHIDAIEIVSMDASCDLVSLHCRYQATNSGVTVSGRNLLVLKRVNNQWLIARHMTVVN
ncbi:MAG TPA: DUF4440 domain-containing protein [Chitinophagaceae bacterium]